ncbi:MAG: hypothetical protein P3W87_004750 [Gammaproteobacteria bacterium]|nr:hypothetical protein [Gammaproteobacteria bacterium]
MSTFGDVLSSVADQLGYESQRHVMPKAIAQAIARSLLGASVALAAVGASAEQREVLPDRAAIHFGEAIGHALGHAVGSSLTKDISNFGIARAVEGITTEVGRTLGALTVEGVRQGAANSRQGVPPSRLTDRVDTAALRAAFALEEWLRAEQDFRNGRIPSRQVSIARNAFMDARSDFSREMRAARNEGLDTRPWEPMLNALSRKYISASEVTELATPMVQRLNRPDGPGYRSASLPAQAEWYGLSDLRARAESRRMDRRQEYSERRYDDDDYAPRY